MLAGLLIVAISVGAVSFAVTLTLSLPLWMAFAAYVMPGMILLLLGAPLFALLNRQDSGVFQHGVGDLQPVRVTQRR